MVSISAFAPYKSEYRKLEGELAFTLSLTRRNTFGPLHMTEIYLPNYGPWHFITEGNHFTYSYGLIDEGLTIPEISELV